ncbi:MAG: hypothetical protein CM15mP85_15930 [Rhodobacterales bacterium]|nr:MAG: hypothetical protein CM15mP85_15930 [Rhodobacterales bacterium]
MDINQKIMFQKNLFISKSKVEMTESDLISSDQVELPSSQVLKLCTVMMLKNKNFLDALSQVNCTIAG